MILNKENYFSQAANFEYMGSSQYKRFVECEALALAELRGEHTRKETSALLIGSFVDAHFEGTLDLFKAQHPEMFIKSGALKAEFQHAEYIIQRIERDQMFMRYMSGEKQVIRTGAINGVPFKIRMDVLHKTAIVDLKVMRDFESQYKPEQGRLNFIEYWGYDLQGAIYQEIERQNNGGKQLPFYIAAVTKEAEPDIGIFEIPQYQLNTALQLVASNAPHYNNLKQALYEPERCEHCDYCKFTKKLNRIMSMEELNA
jgi:hypothetical protein